MSDRVLVIQLGKTGMSFVRHFKRFGCDVQVVDERDEPPLAGVLSDEFPEIEVQKVSSYEQLGDEVAASDIVAVSSGVSPRRLPKYPNYVGDLCCFIKAFRARWHETTKRPQLIAVSGTNGKSTVASLVAGMLNASGDTAEAVGNIGVPLLDALRRWEEDSWPRFVVAELSSFQLAMAGRPVNADIACLLNVLPDHLDWHGDMQSYVQAKGHVFEGSKVGVYDRTDPICRDLVTVAGTKEGFGGKEARPGRWCLDDSELFFAGEPRLSIGVNRLMKTGIMPQSACASLTVAGCATSWREPETQLQWLESAKGLPHRLETVSCISGIKFVDDSKATNEAASIRALELMPGKCILIAGGVDKGQDFKDLAMVAGQKVKSAVLIGVVCDRLEKALNATGVPVERALSMDDAVSKAAAEAERQKVDKVLLSPACSSFDMFTDFAQRGTEFKSAVSGLAQKEYGSA